MDFELVNVQAKFELFYFQDINYENKNILVTFRSNEVSYDQSFAIEFLD